MDWNNDGRKDLVTGYTLGEIRIYLNTGSDLAPAFNNGSSGFTLLQVGGTAFDAAYNSTPEIVDWDNDGDWDILCGNYSGYVYLLVNDAGPGAVPSFSSSSLITDNGSNLDVGAESHPVVFDWNGDGKKDLLVGDSNGKIRYYENVGTDAAPSFNGFSFVQAAGADIDVGEYARPEIFDWNNDLVSDLVVGASDGRVRYYIASRPGTVIVPESATEGDGVLTSQGNVILGQVAASNIVVTLLSDDITAVTVPASVIVPTGSTNALFNITVVDDLNLDGSQSTYVRALLGSDVIGFAEITINDNETAVLGVQLPASATEGDDVLSGQGTLTLSVPPDMNMVVALSTDDDTELAAQPTVIVAAGQTNVTFTLGVVDDQAIDGVQSAQITAHVDNWTDGVASMSIFDNEHTNLIVALPATVNEGDGVLSGAGTVSISGTLPGDLVVTLLSDDTNGVTVPSQITIAAGQISAQFNMTVIDDALYDGRQTVNISAAAAGFTSGNDMTIVVDDEVHYITMSSIASPQIAAVPFSVTITAYDINGENAAFFGTVSLNGSGDSGEVTVVPAVTGDFADGEWTGDLSVNILDTGVALIADDGAGNMVTSLVFDVIAGPVDHFEWGVLPPTEPQNIPFDVSLDARDANGFLVTNFEGSVEISAFISEPPTLSFVGDGSDAWESPMRSFYHDARTQIIYLPSDIGQQGLIDGLALDVTAIPGQQLKAWTIRVKYTSLEQYPVSSAVWEDSGWTTVYQDNITISDTGRIWFAFSDVFYYDGTSNLMVDFSFNNSSYTSDGLCLSTTTAVSRSIIAVSDSAYGNPLSWSGSSSPTPTEVAKIPNIVLSFLNTLDVTPASSGNFTAGCWSGSLTISNLAANVVLKALGDGKTGLSEAFDIVFVEVPAVNNDMGATNVDYHSAMLRGDLTAGGTADIYMYWGESDGGTNASQWANTGILYSVSEGVFSNKLISFSSSTDYHYRCFATNAVGTSWAGATASFTTDVAPIIEQAFHVQRGSFTMPVGALTVTLTNGAD
ncbi:FG-GAP repeat domain-containing protein, partial [Verrucomicrobiota bacterium]